MVGREPSRVCRYATLPVRKWESTIRFPLGKESRGRRRWRPPGEVGPTQGSSDWMQLRPVAGPVADERASSKGRSCRADALIGFVARQLVSLGPCGRLRRPTKRTAEIPRTICQRKPPTVGARAFDLSVPQAPAPVVLQHGEQRDEPPEFE